MQKREDTTLPVPQSGTVAKIVGHIDILGLSGPSSKLSQRPNGAKAQLIQVHQAPYCKRYFIYAPQKMLNALSNFEKVKDYETNDLWEVPVERIRLRY